jgi:hypothetical protein
MSPELRDQGAPAHELQLVSARVVVQLKAKPMLKASTCEAQIFPHDFPDPPCTAEHRRAIDENGACQPIEMMKQNVLAAYVRRLGSTEKRLHLLTLWLVPRASVNVRVASDALEEAGSQGVGRGN